MIINYSCEQIRLIHHLKKTSLQTSHSILFLQWKLRRMDVLNLSLILVDFCSFERME